MKNRIVLIEGKGKSDKHKADNQLTFLWLYLQAHTFSYSIDKFKIKTGTKFSEKVMADKAFALSENLNMTQITLLMNGKIKAGFMFSLDPSWKCNLPVNSQHCFMVPPSQTASAFLNDVYLPIL